MSVDWVNTASDVAALVMLGAYHLRLLHTIRRRPLTTTVGRNRSARDKWVAKVIQQGADLLAVQSLRNWAMTGTFLASTAILIGVGILNFVLAAEHTAQLELVRHGAVPLARGIGALKLLLLASLFFAAFFAFAQTLRLLNHLVFALTVADAEGSPAVAAQLHQAAYFFTLGMRGYYLALPVALWLFGAVYFLVATLVLVGLLWRLDYAGSERE